MNYLFLNLITCLQQPTNVKKERTKKKQATEKQWEEWQQKDEELIKGHYEKDLENAILLSKLEYEEEKKQLKTIESNKKLDIKKKKNKPMSLDAFLTSSNNGNFNL